LENLDLASVAVIPTVIPIVILSAIKY
jgi:hypothetical protein